MKENDVLNNLQKRNNRLKLKLIHQQLKSGSYTSQYFMQYSALVIDEYKKSNSLFKAAVNLGIGPKEVFNWYIQGQQKNSRYRGFYLAIMRINSNMSVQEESVGEKVIDGDFVISEYGDGWSYKTFVDGKKIFLISDNLNDLKNKVKSKNLPLD